MSSALGEELQKGQKGADEGGGGAMRMLGGGIIVATAVRCFPRQSVPQRVRGYHISSRNCYIMEISRTIA